MYLVFELIQIKSRYQLFESIRKSIFPDLHWPRTNTRNIFIPDPETQRLCSGICGKFSVNIFWYLWHEVEINHGKYFLVNFGTMLNQVNIRTLCLVHIHLFNIDRAQGHLAEAIRKLFYQVNHYMAVMVSISYLGVKQLCFLKFDF